LAQVLQPLDDIFPTKDFPALLVGLSSPDDSAVSRVNDEQALISTVDFFPPVVDDPYAFGVIAAANALSDIYAMGGEPILAINLVAFPDTLDKEILTEILRGGAEKVREAGAVIAGGHSVTDKEPKYGMAVTGLVHPARIITKGGAQPGDQLLLTKPLGTGVITTALKNDKAQPEHVESAIVSMSRLNRTASRLAQKYSAHAMTDITGYSLLGHGHEMAHLSEVDFRIAYSTLHWLPGAEDYGAQGIFPGGMWRNREYFEQWVEFEVDLTENQQNLLFDPQTSGGLLIAVAPEKAQPLQDELKSEGVQVCIIGEVQHGIGKIHVVL
jgi:selenide,water dikinase